MSTHMARVVVYTDGGASPNPGAGGWAAVLQYGGAMKEISGGERHTTNNRMELIAAIEALSTLKRPCRVQLYTDSQYVQRGVTDWMPKWKRNGWARGRAGTVKNLDLWQKLDELASRHEVTWSWVPGHAGVALNERCDKLVQEAREAMKKGGK